MPKAKTLKQIKAVEANYKAQHSNLYGTDKFRYGEITPDEYNSILTGVDKVEYIALHTKQLTQHDCGWCRMAHVLGGYCSEDEEWLERMPSKRPLEE